MSYGDCENVPQEIADLKGATIRNAKIVKGDDPDAMSTVVELEVAFRKGHTVEVDGKQAAGGIYQVWADPEGNGPGFLMMVGYMTLEPAKTKAAA